MLVLLGCGWNIARTELINIDQWIPRVSSTDKDLPRCELPARSGKRVGVCKDVETLQSELTFCRDAVCYTACTPPSQPLWPEWTAQAKDQLLGDLFKKTIESRIFSEVSVARIQDVTMRFSQNLACIEAYKNALCWYNFPKCGCGESLSLCRSVCINYYRACGFATSAGIFPECEDLALREVGLFSSYIAHDPSLAVAEHVLMEPAPLICSERRLDAMNATDAKRDASTTAVPRKLEEKHWGDAIPEAFMSHSPVPLIIVAALWEVIGLAILLLMAFAPLYWQKGKSLLLTAFCVLTVCGLVLTVMQLNALRSPPVRASDKGPAQVQCPSELVQLVPESCATVFTMDQLEMMVCNSCTGASYRHAPNALVAVVALIWKCA